jgi:hypothetical protein
MRGGKRGQSAIELMTFVGWTLFFILLSVVVISFFFGFDKASIARHECTLSPGLACKDYRIDEGSIRLDVRNNMDWDLGNIYFSYKNCDFSSNERSLDSGEKATFTIIGCDFSPGELFESESIYVNYTFAGNSIVHKKQFTLTTVVEGGNSQSFGQGSYTSDGGTLMLLKFDEVDGNVSIDSSGKGNNGNLTNFDTAVGMWRFNDGNSITVIDGSPYGNDGVLGDGLCVIGVDKCPLRTAFGVYGPALLFDGEDDYVDVGNDDSLNPTGNLTISAWVKWNSHASSGKKNTIVSKGTNMDSYGFFVKGNPTVQLEAVVEKSAITPFASFDGVWSYVAMSYDTFARRVYLDGNLMDTNTDTPLGLIDYTTDPLWIGNSDFPADPQYKFNGTIDEVAIYNETLTIDEIKWRHQAKRAILYRGWSTGKYDGGMQFDGVDDFINLGDNPNLEFGNNNFTIEAWIRLDKLPSVSGRPYTILSKFKGGQLEYWFYVKGTGIASELDKLSFEVTENGFSTVKINSLPGADPLTVGQWYHVAVVKEDKDVRLFVDGEIVNSASGFPIILHTGTAKAYVGDHEAAANGLFKGIIDDLRVSNFSRY